MVTTTETILIRQGEYLLFSLSLRVKDVISSLLIWGNFSENPLALFSSLDSIRLWISSSRSLLCL